MGTKIGRSTVRFELKTEIFHAAADVRMISFLNTLKQLLLKKHSLACTNSPTRPITGVVLAMRPTVCIKYQCCTDKSLP